MRTYSDDDAAIPPDKTALIPGAKATSSKAMSYPRGTQRGHPRLDSGAGTR